MRKHTIKANGAEYSIHTNTIEGLPVPEALKIGNLIDAAPDGILEHAIVRQSNPILQGALLLTLK